MFLLIGLKLEGKINTNYGVYPAAELLGFFLRKCSSSRRLILMNDYEEFAL